MPENGKIVAGSCIIYRIISKILNDEDLLWNQSEANILIGVVNLQLNIAWGDTNCIDIWY